MQNIVLFLLLLPFAQEEKVWDCTEAAVRITAPAHWVAEKELRPGERTCTFTLRTPENLDVSITLVAWDEMGGVPARTLWKKRPPSEGTLLSQRMLEVAGKTAYGGKYRLGSLLKEEVVLSRDSVAYLWTLITPEKEWDRYGKIFHRLLSHLEWGTFPKKPSPPVKVAWQPQKNRTVLLVPVEEEETYLSAIPAAAMLNGGTPVVLRYNRKKVHPSLLRFLQEYRPNIITVGPKLPWIRSTQVSRVSELYRRPSIVIFAGSVESGVVAAPIATRMNAPLVFSADEVRTLSPQRVYVTGEASFPGAVPLPTTPGKYIAVCNVKGKDRSFLFAAALAAAHGGSVLALDEEIRIETATLRTTSRQPPGLPPSKESSYLVGSLFDRKVALPIHSRRKVELGNRQWDLTDTFYGDPSIDLNQNESFEDPNELFLFGSTVELEGRRWNITARFRSFADPSNEEDQKLDLISPPAEDLQAKIRAYYGKTPPEYIVLVGTSREIPFDYRRSEYYYTVQGWTSATLASDSLYANADEDPYLEIAVGRFPIQDAETGSAMIATTLSYRDLRTQARPLTINPGFPKLDEKTGWPTVLPEAESSLRAVEKEFAAAGYETEGLYREEATLKKTRERIAKSNFLFYENHSGAETWSFGEETLVPNWTGRIFYDPLPGWGELPPLQGAPIVFCGGCLSGGIDLAQNTFPNGFLMRGAAAYIGNTRFALSGPGGYPLRRMVNALLYEKATLGEALRKGKNHALYVAQNGFTKESPYSSREELIEGFHTLTLFGDPALPVGLKGIVPFEKNFLSFDEKRARIQVRWTGDSWKYNVSNGKEEVAVQTGQGLEYAPRNRPDRLPGTVLKIPAPDGALSAHLWLSEGPAWALRGWELLDGELRIELAFLRPIHTARNLEIQVHWSASPPPPPLRWTADGKGYQITLPSDEWKIQAAKGGHYLVDITHPRNSLHITSWKPAYYTLENFTTKRPIDFESYYPEAKVVGSGHLSLRGKKIPWIDYQVSYPGEMRYHTREIFLLQGTRGVLVTLYVTPEPEGKKRAWMERAVDLLKEITISEE